MRRYSKSDEQNVRIQALVREWMRSGLLNEAQSARLCEEARPDFRRTNNFLRLVLFLFTGLIVAAAFLLAIELLQIRNDPTPEACAVAAVVCFGSAELLIGRYRVYRFGIEEALGVAAVVFLVISAGQMASSADFRTMLVLMLSVVALGSLVLYGRFGFLYAGITAIAGAALAPLPLIHSEVTQRILCGAMLGGIFLVAGRYHFVHGDDFPGDDYAVFQAAAWTGLYAVANLHMTSSGITTGRFYWATYGMIWLLPIAGLLMSIRKKDRLLMDVSVAMALATLATNKSYLGSEHQTWDPMLLGAFLMGAAIFIRRWLAGGPNGQRYGFTPARILSKDARLMTVVSTASAAFQPQPPLPEPVPQPRFGGGRSGGGGATGEF